METDASIKIKSPKAIIDMDCYPIYVKENGIEKPISEWLDEEVNKRVYKHKIWVITSINSGLIVGLFMALMLLTNS